MHKTLSLFVNLPAKVLPFSVSLYFCERLVGLHGIVYEINPRSRIRINVRRRFPLSFSCPRLFIISLVYCAVFKHRSKMLISVAVRPSTSFSISSCASSCTSALKLGICTLKYVRAEKNLGFSRQFLCYLPLRLVPTTIFKLHCND